MFAVNFQLPRVARWLVRVAVISSALLAVAGPAQMRAGGAQAPTIAGQAATGSSQAFRSDAAFGAEVTAARAPGTALPEQIAHWQRASGLAGGQCAECLERLATLNFRAAQWEAAIRAAREFAAISPKPADQGYAELLHGSALFHLNDDQPTRNELSEADAAFRAAVAADPTLRTALYLDGRALAALQRDEAAREAFTRYVALAPADDRYRARAQEYLKKLSLARVSMAPPFTVKTLDGRTITLDELQGRVVLLDFWATWCVPCQQFLPRLQKLAADLNGEPLTIVSVSWDEDEDAWKQYVAKHGMSWPQVLDSAHTLSDSYGVDGLPHYFTIDADGALQSEVVGVGDDDLESRVRLLLAKATREAHPRRRIDKISTAPAVGAPGK